MDGMTAMGEATSNPVAMTARVLTDAKREFSDLADAPMLERFAQEAVADLWGESIRVRTFVPVLALRRVREMVEGRSGPVLFTEDAD